LIAGTALYNRQGEEFSALRASSPKDFPDNAEGDATDEEKNEKNGITTHEAPPFTFDDPASDRDNHHTDACHRIRKLSKYFSRSIASTRHIINIDAAHGNGD
jgi:hypothetical protein